MHKCNAMQILKAKTKKQKTKHQNKKGHKEY